MHVATLGAPPDTVRVVSPTRGRLVMYGEPSRAAALDWPWVDAQLAAAGTYWVVASGGEHPHPRPVWGVWRDEVLHLGVGGPVVSRLLELAAVRHGAPRQRRRQPSSSRAPSPVRAPTHKVIRTYDDKYDWNYTVEEYGPLTRIEPATVLAWRSAGWAGRDGFQETGRWQF